MSRPKKETTRRLNLALGPPAAKRLDRLMAKSEAESITELFRLSLAAYELIIDVQADGRQIVIEDSDGGNRERLRIL